MFIPKIEKRRVEALKFYPENPRKITKELKEKLKRSIAEFGFVEPLVINKDNEVIGGNARLSVLKELNIKEVDCVVIELDKERERALNLALNKITGDWDYEMLNKILKDLDETWKEVAGFEVEEVAAFDVEVIEGDNLGKVGRRTIIPRGLKIISITFGDWKGFIRVDDRVKELEERLQGITDVLEKANKIAEKIFEILWEHKDEILRI